MNSVLTFLLILIITSSDFKADQRKFQRVADAFQSKQNIVNSILTKHAIKINRLEIYIRIFKKEKRLELWARNKNEKFVLIQTYQICASSGDLGPKRQQGDNQTPEGFYYINSFNPFSNFYLSLGINYPNNADKIRNKTKNPGGDIYIHGNCVTIGCIPITDDKIKELYIYAVEAKNNGQENIPVHIFPTILDKENFMLLRRDYKSDSRLIAFWENLKVGYDFFETKHEIPQIIIGENGNYNFK